jgi:UPF0716 protein FxsA
MMLLLPVLELVAFTLVAMSIGFGKAVLLQAAISLIGVALLGSLVTEAKARARQGGGVLSFALDGRHGMRGLAGLLFAIPGFVTDALGVVALVPELRTRLRRLILGPEKAAKAESPKAPRPAQVDMLDLDRAEWREVEPAGRPKG